MNWHDNDSPLKQQFTIARQSLNHSWLLNYVIKLKDEESSSQFHAVKKNSCNTIVCPVTRL